jgi:hypothetical protein
MAVLVLIPIVSVPGLTSHTRVTFGRFLTHSRAHSPIFNGELTSSQKLGLKGGGKLSLNIGRGLLLLARWN